MRIVSFLGMVLTCMPWTRFTLMALIGSLCIANSARAEDIDLFAYQGAAPGSAANILFVLDNAANFSANVSSQRCSIAPDGSVDTSGGGSYPTQLDGTAGAVEQCALYAALKAIDSSASGTFSMGVLGFNDTGMKTYDPVTNAFSSGCSGNTGGCLLMPMVAFNTSNKVNILDWIRQWAVSGNSNFNIKSNNSANGAAMQEAWAYFKGKTGVSGRNYAGMQPTSACGNSNYVIFVGNAYRNNSTPGDQTNENNSPKKPLEGTSSDSNKRADPPATAAERALISETITTAQCGTSSLQSSESKGVYALNWARYMKNQHDITTYSIGVLGPTCNAEYAAHLTKLGAGDVGGGKFFPTTDYNELAVAISTIVSEILTVNTVFASVSLPVSVNTQGLFLNQIYVGMFRPSDGFLPRWNGNLKQYKLGLKADGTGIEAKDAGDVTATNPQTGFIASCARSFWTPNSVDSYWANNPSGTCLAVVGENNAQLLKGSNYPDGEVVEKGGQAYQLRLTSPTARSVKTCGFSSCTSLTDFATTNPAITQALLGVSSASERDLLIDWARGANVKASENELSLGTSAMRASVHGDVVHSRPVAVNHGSDASPNIVVYYGANDGLLRAVNGNRTASIGSTPAGGELWSFMPPDFYGRIKRLYDNDQAISYPGTGVAGAAPKDYGMDGPVTAFQGSVGGLNKTYIFSTMRRGGRSLYAFDVSSPASPSLLWRKGCPNLDNDTGCTNDASGDFTGIGQTWSSLKPIKVSGVASPLVILGGGYDKCEDHDALSAGGANHRCDTTVTGGSSSKGRRVYVLNATDGSIVKAFETARAVVAEPTIAANEAGEAQWAYVGDTGGNLYRITFAAGGAANWTITRIASVGCGTATASAVTTSGYGPHTSACVAPRKILYPPSVVTPDGTNFFVAVGTGDREKPVLHYAASQSTSNLLVQVKDRPADATWIAQENATCGADVVCLNSLYPITTSATPTSTQLATKPRGWYLGLAAAEQVVTSPVTVFGVTTFSTNQAQPAPPNACAPNLGITRVYNISYVDASPVGTLPDGTTPTVRFERVVGDGLPPSPVAGRVKLDDGTITPFCIGCDAASPLTGAKPKELATVIQPKGRRYWYLEK